MFRAVVQNCGNERVCFQQAISADSLHEAEQAILRYLHKHNAGKRLLLIHVGDLVYEVFEVEEPIARVRIEIA